MKSIDSWDTGWNIEKLKFSRPNHIVCIWNSLCPDKLADPEGSSPNEHSHISVRCALLKL